MTEQGEKYIADIILSINNIEDFMSDFNTFERYESSLKTQSAIERQLAIIGEALNKLKKVEPEIEIENEKQIISFRNRLVHAYDNIDNAIVWTIIKKHLPLLKKEIIRIRK